MSVADYLRPEGWLSATGGPLYVQLRKRIAAGIEGGLLPPDTALPPEREIAALTELSRVTVRKALAELAETGAVVQRQGAGSWVAPKRGRVEQQLSVLTSFTEDMARRGLATETRWLERGLFLPNADERTRLGLAEGDQVARLSRLRLAGGRPMALERASLPTPVLPNPLEVSASLYAVLGARGLRPVRAVQKISAINLGPEDADLLGVPVQSAGLRIERLSSLADGTPVELTRSLYRGDTYDFVAELRMDGGMTG
jgi:GntR family transcriptional regulator